MKKDGRTLDHKTLEHLRISAVLRVRKGEKPSAVMKSLGMSRTVIYRWLSAASTKGVAALRSRQSRGPLPKLSTRQQQELKRVILTSDPRSHGYEEALWSTRIIKELIAKKFGQSMSRVSVASTLHKLGITPRKPLRRAYERDSQRVEEWKMKTLPQIVKRARKRKAVILFLDEAGIQSDAPLGQTWGKKGSRTEVRTSGQRQKINAVSAISPNGEFKYELYTCRFNAAFFIEVLKRFVKRMRRPCFFIVDGHPSHRANLVKKYIASTKGKVELYFIPPYAPDLNPDEFVWHHIKTNGISKKPLRKNESLTVRVTNDLEEIKNKPKLVRSFFKASSVAYPT